MLIPYYGPNVWVDPQTRMNLAHYHALGGLTPAGLDWSPALDAGDPPAPVYQAPGLSPLPALSTPAATGPTMKPLAPKLALSPRALQPVPLVSLLWRAGLRGRDLLIGVRVVLGESGANPRAVNAGTDDWGLWQLNLPTWGPVGLTKAIALDAGKATAWVRRHVWPRYGWRPWRGATRLHREQDALARRAIAAWEQSTGNDAGIGRSEPWPMPIDALPPRMLENQTVANLQRPAGGSGVGAGILLAALAALALT